MTDYEFALSDLAMRLAGTDATLTTAIATSSPPRCRN
jgi:hypothetical protein